MEVKEAWCVYVLPLPPFPVLSGRQGGLCRIRSVTSFYGNLLCDLRILLDLSEL